MERAKGFEPSTQNAEPSQLQAIPKSPRGRYTQIRAQILEEDERLRVYRLWPQLPPRIHKAILSLVDASVEEEDGQ
jgi:hypothetical protein